MSAMISIFLFIMVERNVWPRKHIWSEILLLISLGLFPFLVPFLLLLLDRKNFWKVAS